MPEFIDEVANSPLLICTAVPVVIVCEVVEVGKVTPNVVLAPAIPIPVTLVVTVINL